MSLAPPLQQLIAAKLAHATTPQWELPIAEVRRNFADLWTPAITGAPVAVDAVEDRVIPGRSGAIPTRIYTPEAAACPLLMYFHGGGYVKGGLNDADAFCRRLAGATGRVVVA